jgi:hypothetical protein
MSIPQWIMNSAGNSFCGPSGESVHLPAPYTTVGQVSTRRANDSFRSGTPIQTSVIHQQVIVDAVEKTFTVVNSNTITSAERFWLDGTEYELGKGGETFKTRLVGVLKVRDGSTPPPTGYFSGYSEGVKK